jgi:hypothetical protein
VTANQAQKPFNKGALQRDFFRQMRFLLHGSGLDKVTIFAVFTAVLEFFHQVARAVE